MDRHPLKGPTRLGRHGNPVLTRSTLGPLYERGDAYAAVSEPPPQAAMMAAPAPVEEEWWEHAYAGGPMVDVPGFPRPLYPPDAADSGKTPSVKGPDVVAYKRTICRLGRWNPWDPAAWDEAYNNAFSHGRGTGMVGDTGVAGVQRQQRISPASGWLGQKTFNTLRSARVPDVFPHGGEMAMDSVAVNLIEEAWAMFAGAPDPPAGTEADIMSAITDYLVRSIKAAGKWHYSQNRAMSNFGDAPEAEQWADCSGQSTSVYYWAKIKTGLTVPDPNRYCPGFGGFNGYGWTGSLVYAPKCSAPYRVGDLAIYGSSSGNTSHVVTCYAAGDASSAEWCSNGSEEAPYAVELHYRGDLLSVHRPGLLVA